MNRVACVSFTCSDADLLEAFYRDAFGFETLDASYHSGTNFSRLVGIDGAEARALRLGLGEQTIELLEFVKPGEQYPADCTSDDLRFQHIAIVVSEMEAAYSRLSGENRWTPISRPAPQRLPEGSGGVTAFKFRDPEGHPLELLAFPEGKVPRIWQNASGNRGPCLGIDHSAIVVASTTRSANFYQHVLGLLIGSRSLNRGKEQEQLDCVPNPVVEVTALDPTPSSTPHLELLCYLSPARQQPRAAKLLSNDVAATRLVIEVEDFPSLEQKLDAMPVSFISFGRAILEDRRPAVSICDPDGHALVLVGMPGT